MQSKVGRIYWEWNRQMTRPSSLSLPGCSLAPAAYNATYTTVHLISSITDGLIPPSGNGPAKPCVQDERTPYMVSDGECERLSLSADRPDQTVTVRPSLNGLERIGRNFPFFGLLVGHIDLGQCWGWGQLGQTSGRGQQQRAAVDQWRQLGMLLYNSMSA